MSQSEIPTRPHPRPALARLQPYVPGKAKTGATDVIKLSSNESALGPSPAAMAAYRAETARLERYPDGAASDLRAAIGEVHGLDPARLIIGAGSDEIISMTIRAYAGPGDSIIQSAHGFSYYHIAAGAAEVETLFVPETGLTADVTALGLAATAETKVLFLANPNNPTGTFLAAGEVRRLRQTLPSHVILVLDGAYAEYMDDNDYADGRDMVDEAIKTGADNVIMMRTFSKIYGLGGLRVGWAYAPPSVIDILGRIRPPFNVAAPALAAAAAAIRDKQFVRQNREHNAKERDRLTRMISAFGYRVTPSAGNFLLFTPQTDSRETDLEKAQALLAGLERRGVLIRSAASSGLPGHLRVSIGPVTDNDAFLGALADHVHESAKGE